MSIEGYKVAMDGTLTFLAFELLGWLVGIHFSVPFVKFP